MVTNLMETYKKYVGVFLKDFTKMFFEDEYVEEFSTEYIEAYIDSRYYNMGEKKERYFYTTVFASLMARRESLKREYGKKYTPILDKILNMYQFVFYVDGLRNMPDMEEFVTLLCTKRLENFGLSETKNLNKKFIRLIKGFFQFKENFLNSFQSENFALNIQKYPLIDNAYKVELEYDFEFSYVYSKKIIEEVYNTGIVNEDKNIIAYTLLTVECIRDINNCNFDKKYLISFANTLFKKKNKLNQSLRIFYNVAIQDKIILKIQYEDFVIYKEEICALIGDGFRFAIILDESFKVNLLELRKLDIFEYILVPKEGKTAEKVQELEKRINNIVIYDF